MHNWVKDTVERNTFGVCEYLGEKIGVSSARIRVYFIYISFIAMGSPLIIYLFMAFWMNIKQYIRNGKNTIWG